MNPDMDEYSPDDFFDYHRASADSVTLQRTLDTTTAAHEALERKSFVTKVSIDFQVALQADQGGCFRTEVRDSKIFICGVHQKSIWDESDEACPDMAQLIGLLAKVLSANLVVKKPSVTLPVDGPARSLMDAIGEVVKTPEGKILKGKILAGSNIDIWDDDSE